MASSAPLTHHEACIDAAAFCRQAGRPDLSRRLLESAPRPDPDPAATAIQLGAALIDLGRIEEALKGLNGALSQTRTRLQRATLLLGIARAYRAEGQHRLAVEKIEEARPYVDSDLD